MCSWSDETGKVLLLRLVLLMLIQYMLSLKLMTLGHGLSDGVIYADKVRQRTLNIVVPLVLRASGHETPN